MKTYEITFSPTGGTKKVADIITQELGNDVIEIDLSNPKEDLTKYQLTQEDIAVIALPSYGGRAPEIAIERLKKIQGNGAHCIIVTVYGNRDYEDTLIEMFDTVRENDFHPIGAISAVAQHSIFPQYATNRPDAEDKRELTGFTRKILDNDSKEISEVPGNRPYKRIGNVPLVPKPTKNCTQCKTCVVVCPVEAIDPVSFKSDKDKCIACMRCLTVCPANARKINKVLSNVAAMALKKEASKRKSNEIFI